MTGMFFLLFGNYCLRAAFDEETSFIRWTVTTRPTTLVFLSVFVALGMVAPVILIFGVIDVVASMWTAWALRADARRGAGSSDEHLNAAAASADQKLPQSNELPL